jgi:hypothetical protein
MNRRNWKEEIEREEVFDSFGEMEEESLIIEEDTVYEIDWECIKKKGKPCR